MMPEPDALQPLVADLDDRYLPWTGFIGEAILLAMLEDGTLPAQSISSWVPLGSPSADLEQAYGENGCHYVWFMSINRVFRYWPS